MTELEKAARAALEQLEFLNACYPHKTAADTITALTQALATTEPGVPTIDLDLLDWERIKEAAAASKWIPPEYYQNDWVADVCEFLKDRPQPAPTEHLIYEDGSPGPKLHSPEWFAAKRQEAVDRIASMPEAMQQNMHDAAATLPTAPDVPETNFGNTTERKGEQP